MYEPTDAIYSIIFLLAVFSYPVSALIEFLRGR